MNLTIQPGSTPGSDMAVERPDVGTKATQIRSKHQIITDGMAYWEPIAKQIVRQQQVKAAKQKAMDTKHDS